MPLYRLLLAEFQALLQLMSRSLKRSDTLTLLIDGADVLCGHAGELTSDWIPDFLPQVCNFYLLLPLMNQFIVDYANARSQ